MLQKASIRHFLIFTFFSFERLSFLIEFNQLIYRLSAGCECGRYEFRIQSFPHSDTIKTHMFRHLVHHFCIKRLKCYGLTFTASLVSIVSGVAIAGVGAMSILGLLGGCSPLEDEGAAATTGADET